jgi:nitroreductase
MPGRERMELVDIVEERRSIRAFAPDKVSRLQVEDILRVAIRAPSAINLQPWEITVVMDDERKRLSRRLMKAYNEKRISCSPGNVKPMPTQFSKRGAESFEAMKPFLDEMGFDFNTFINEGSCNFYGAPVAIILSIDSAFSKARFVDLGLFVGYFILAAHDAGLGTCPIGLITAYEEEVKDVLNLPDDKNVVIGLALGHPYHESPINRFISPREGLEKIVRWV